MPLDAPSPSSAGTDRAALNVAKEPRYAHPTPLHLHILKPALSIALNRHNMTDALIAGHGPPSDASLALTVVG